MKKYFVTGTDTDVGKTVISALLVRQLDAYYWKPVQSGTIEAEDKLEVQKLAGLTDDRILSCAYELSEPLSPHAAALLDNIEISLNEIKLPIVDGNLIIEGAGGIFVPLNETELMIDLIKKLNLEVIVVARSTLGTINHTLMTLECLKKRGIVIKGVILNGPLNQSNKKAIESFGQVDILGEIPTLEELNFSTIDKNIFNL